MNNFVSINIYRRLFGAEIIFFKERVFFDVSRKWPNKKLFFSLIASFYTTL